MLEAKCGLKTLLTGVFLDHDVIDYSKISTKVIIPQKKVHRIVLVSSWTGSTSDFKVNFQAPGVIEGTSFSLHLSPFIVVVLNLYHLSGVKMIKKGFKIRI